MAAMMSSVNPFTPVTPPPESHAFPKPPVPRPFQNNLKRKAAIQEPHALTVPAIPPPPPTSQPQTASSPGGSSHDDSKSSPPPPSVGGANLDPKYLAMVSRIAAYYQQRCQAVANYQQQRCQAWANMHRQRCQDMMQASMLVVAWYVRDRIQRRRRREKRRFKSGLRRRTAQPKITRTEVVRRWVKQVPEAPESPNTTVTNLITTDQAEAEFSMDKDPVPDKDAKLFEMADNLIKSQYKKIEVPIMGVLNFDESDNDSESEPEEPEQFEDMDENEDDVEGDEYYEVEDDDLYDDDEMEYEGDDGSEVVHHGTGTGSGSRGNDRSESS
ncbi:hypothetical protein QQZ08_002317 [Neonectria magnoliae]|uniref:Uncharacterized protein n=1 Tax=Neonectria magnoliae TaxID=2732573 RepID=A0ABR1IBS6_9HYPO